MEGPGAREFLLAPAGQEELGALWGDTLAAIERAERSGTALGRAGRRLLKRLRSETGSYKTTLRLTRLGRTVVAILGDVDVRVDREGGEIRRCSLDLSFYWRWGAYCAFDYGDPLGQAKQITLAFNGEEHFGTFTTEVFLEPETPDGLPRKIDQEYPLNKLISASLQDHLNPE